MLGSVLALPVVHVIGLVSKVVSETISRTMDRILNL